MPVASPFVSLLLRSLKYPRSDDFDAEDPAQFQAALVWLENTKVRLYPIEGRQQLQSKVQQRFEAALHQYLKDIECPIAYNGSNRAAVLRWLLTHAVGLEYTDAAEQLNQVAQAAEKEAGQPEDWTEAALPPFADIGTEAVRAALIQLQQLLHVQDSGSGSSSSGGTPAEATAEGLQRAHAMLESCVLPAVAELAKQQQQHGGSRAGGDGGAMAAATAEAPSSQQSAVQAMLAKYPLGFSTGDGTADLAATILRMLYIKDLRALQTQMDAAIVQVQEFTANPRTDASLGKVGH